MNKKTYAKTLVQITFLTTLLLLLLSSDAISQDKLIQRDGKRLTVRVIQITDETVTYTFPGQEEVEITVNHAKLDRIDFENGEEMSFTKELSDDMAYFAEDSRNILKTPFLNYTVGTISFQYERALDYKSSYQVGITGLNMFNSFYVDVNGGILVNGGYKFKILGKKSYTKHAMTGLYIMPSIRSGYFKLQENDRSTPESEIISIPAIFDVSFGGQFVISDIFVIDYHIFAGIGTLGTSNDFVRRENLLGRSQALIDGYHIGSSLSIGFCFGDKLGKQKIKN